MNPAAQYFADMIDHMQRQAREVSTDADVRQKISANPGLLFTTKSTCFSSPLITSFVLS